MIVRCISKSIESLQPPSHLASHRAYIKYDEIYLAVGCHYLVYGIVYRDGIPWFLVCEELDDEYPLPRIASFFEIVDDRIPPNWAYRFGKGAFGESEMIPVPWIRDLRYLGQLVDGVPSAVEAFRALQRDLAEWHGEEVASLPGLPSWLFPNSPSASENEEE